jgi:hypothetical protein
MSGMQEIVPSGRQFKLSDGERRAVVAEVGGGLREYTAGGKAPAGRVVDEQVGDHVSAGDRRCVGGCASSGW